MRIVGALAALAMLAGCRDSAPVFRLVSSNESGIHFSNVLGESDSLNIISFEYFYNGAGVGAADFNNDGLTDLFFAGNLTTSRLYLNQGHLSFEDITSSSGVETKVWCTGVSTVDINGDGWMDVHLSTIHPDMTKKVSNIFFINQGPDQQGIPHFVNRAGDLGLADSAYSSQSVFLDYDLDGDLDMYLLTNALENYTRNSPIGQRQDGTGKSVDKLFRQDTLADGTMNFTDVSARSNILTEGWGLGIIANDFNADGWPDIYCANDFLSSDHLYINQHDGTFRDDIGAYMNHQEFNGMGTDMADLNNDGLNDLVVLDMMPNDNLRQKTMFSGMGYDRFMKSLAMNYQAQYVRNVLQKNNGNNTFSDVGYQSGIYATDWSWSVLLADFDNDGLRDMFITNGYPKDITNLDFVMYRKDLSRFGTEELKRKSAAEAIRELEGVYKPGFLFHNKGDFQFDDVSASWGFTKPAYSTGAAYADLDNDGDLDLVVNNLNDEVHLFENTTSGRKQGAANFLRVKVKGTPGNPHGIGVAVWIYCNGEVHYGEQQIQRGYLSSVDPVMHFGLGSSTVIDSLLVRWPGGACQRLRNVQANSTVEISSQESGPCAPAAARKATMLIAENDVSQWAGAESDYIDYKYGQSTLPHKFSRLGPHLAAGDINGDGMEDVVVGAPAHSGARILYQQQGGTFREDSLEVKEAEDVGLLLFDADGDLDLDLYCVSGSSEFGRNTRAYQDRFYRNDGHGKFSLDISALPTIESSGSCVITTDFDHDNDLDLFVGGRVVPMSYPLTPRSYLLRNDGTGRFIDVTIEISQGADSVGMVTDALFTDFDNDGWSDLIVVGEWMPVTFLKNNEGRFAKIKELKTGWWNSLAAGDFDGDGDVDYIAGNRGRNSVYQVRDGEPVSIYAKDFDGNGSVDPIISRYIAGKERPVHYRETMTEQVAGLRKILKSYEAYGKMDTREILDFLGSENTVVKHADWLESSYIENSGNGDFSVHPLPSGAQTSPINGIVVCDLNGDSLLDFLAVGNSLSEETLSGFNDAGIGVCALGKGDGSFELVPPARSGLCIRSDAKSIVGIKVGSTRAWAVGSNGTPLIILMEANP